MTRTANINSLTHILGRTFGLYAQTHSYHWNVEGPQFRQMHQLFEDQYQNLFEALDEIAERIRCLGAYAPASLGEMVALAGPDPKPAQSADAMMGALITAHEAMAQDLRAAIATAQEDEDEVSAGMLTDRLEWHEKELWMMKAARG